MTRRKSKPDDEFVHGRVAAPWSDVHDWIGLADGVQPPAHALYVKLKMHLNQKRGDNLCWPGKEVLAELMGFAKSDSVNPYITQLERVGAIDVERVGQPGRNRYALNDMPADWYCVESTWPLRGDGRCKPHRDAGGPCEGRKYDGPMNLEQWYQRHDPAITARKDAANAKVTRQRSKERALREKQQASPDTRSAGYQGTDPSDTRSSGYQETPSSGYQETPSSGDLDTRYSGAEQERNEQERNEQQGGSTAPLTPPAAPRPDSVGSWERITFGHRKHRPATTQCDR